MNDKAYGGAGTANAATPVHGDTFTGQIAHMDQLIDSARTILARLTEKADQLAPAQSMPEGPGLGKVVGRIDQAPDAGPLLFRMQNRNAELHRLQGDIFQQLNRLDQVL